MCVKQTRAIVVYMSLILVGKYFTFLILHSWLPDSAIWKSLRYAETLNIPFTKYYKVLVNRYGTPDSCQEILQNNFRTKWTVKIKSDAEADEDSRLGTYFRINPGLDPWIPTPQSILEVERKLITRYRTNSHSLNIEVMRYSGVNRENRLCTCKLDVQTIWHVCMCCPLSVGIFPRNEYNNLNDLFNDPFVHVYLLKLSKTLKIPTGRMWEITRCAGSPFTWKLLGNSLIIRTHLIL